MEIDAPLDLVPEFWHNDRLHFFKYMTASTAKIVLADRTLRWSTASELNDPFDMQFNLSINVDREQLRVAALDKMWELYAGDQPIPARNIVGVMMELLRQAPEKMARGEFEAQFGPSVVEGYDRLIARLPKTNAEVESHVASNKILSLTTAPDNNLMWTHYTNGHRGVVMRFRSIPAFDSVYGMAKPMNYVTDVPSLYSEQDLVEIISGIATTDAGEILDKIILTKSADYEYEKEWRASTGFGRNEDAPFEDVQFGVNELDGIVFGMRISDDDKTQIQMLASEYPNVELMRAVRTSSGLTIDVDTI